MDLNVLNVKHIDIDPSHPNQSQQINHKQNFLKQAPHLK